MLKTDKSKIEVLDDWTLRENKSEKLRPDLIPIEMIRKLALHYTNWIKVYWEWQWENGWESMIKSCKQSAYRHFLAWMAWEEDEPHDMALVWNIFTYETLKLRRWIK